MFVVSLHPKCYYRRNVFLFCFILFIIDVCCYNNLKCRHLAYLRKGWICCECVVCSMCDQLNTMFLFIIFSTDCENVVLSIKVNQNAVLWKLHALLHTGILCKRLLPDSYRIYGNYCLGSHHFQIPDSALRQCFWFRWYLVRWSGWQLS